MSRSLAPGTSAATVVANRRAKAATGPAQDIRPEVQAAQNQAAESISEMTVQVVIGGQTVEKKVFVLGLHDSDDPDAYVV